MQKNLDLQFDADTIFSYVGIIQIRLRVEIRFPLSR